MAQRGIRLPIGSELDERSATATAQRIQKVFETAGKDASKSFSDKLSDGISGSGKAAQAAAKTASDAYDKMRDSAGKLIVEEKKLQDLRDKGARDTQITAQAQRLEAARRAEARATRDATKAYQDYEQASGKAGQGFKASLKSIAGEARESGGSAASEFVSGFAGASALARFGAAGGPVGLAIAGLAIGGFAAGKTLADQFNAGLETLQVRDTFRAKMGIDPAAMQTYGNAAAKAYANGFGTSVEENLKSLQFSVQAGLINKNSSEADAQALMQSVDTVSKVTDANPEEIARGTRNFIKTGLVDNYQQAFDLIVAAQQKGLNISGDLLDTAEEYGTTLHAVGLSGADAFGLIAQMQSAGVRNTDVAADSLKELSINVADGSKSTKQAFEAMGLNADNLTRKFAEGGPAAREAFGEVITGLRNIEDPVQQQLVGLALYKTKWEDAKVAIKGANLDTAAKEMGDLNGKTKDATTALNEHTNQWDLLGRNIDTTMSKLQTWLADTSIGRFATQGFPGFFNNSLFADAGANAQAQMDAARAAADKQNALGTGFHNAGDAQRAHRGLPTAAGSDDRGPVTPMIPGADQTSGSQKPSFSLSQYGLDAVPIGGFQGLNAGSAPGVTPIRPGQGPGYVEVDPDKIFDAETSLMSQKTAVESARVRLLELQADNNHTEQDLQSAKTAVLSSERAYQSAQTKLAEAQQGTWKKMENSAKGFADGMGQIGAALDNDLGISKGLSGMAENLTKFLANLAFAPALGALNAVVTASGGQAATGSGLVGVLAAQGAFGQQYTAQGQYAAAQAGTAGGYGSPVGGGQPYGLAPGTNTGGYGTSGPAFPAWVHALEQQFGVKASTYAGHQESDRHEAGYAPNPNHENRGIDWSGTPDAMQNFANYLATIPGSLEQVIFQNPNTGQDTTIAGGKLVSGYYDASTLAEHENHVHTRQSQGIPLPGGFGSAGYTQSSGPVPVNVVNSADLTGGTDQSSIAKSIFSAFTGAGYSPQSAMTAVQAGLLESGLNPAAMNSSGHNSLFQTSADKGIGSDPASQIAWALAEAGRQGGPAAMNADPANFWANNVERGGYPGSMYDSFAPRASELVGAGVPQGGYGVTGGPGQAGGPGLGQPAANPFGAPSPFAGQAGIGAGSGGVAPPSNPGGGKAGLSGAPMDALMGAASGLDMVMPGAGAVAKIGIQEINRAIEFAGQVTGIAAGGVGEFLSVGDNPRGSLGASWFGKLAGGLAVARPALPNMAGQKPPQQPAGQAAPAGSPQNTTNINVTNNRATEDGTGKDIAAHQAAMSAPPGRQ